MPFQLKRYRQRLKPDLMINKIRLHFVVAILICASTNLNSQTAWYYQWGLLPEKTIEYFIGESSGEQAYNSVIDLSEFNRQRTSEEYSGTLFEAEYVTGKLKDKGLERHLGITLGSESGDG